MQKNTILMEVKMDWNKEILSKIDFENIKNKEEKEK